MAEIIRKNEKCFIGMPACGYGYESAKLCFVACSSDSKYTIKLDLIKSIVEGRQYECHIALKKIDPGNLAFCTKICSKMIQSQFCIVLLDPSIDEDGLEYPNPNVNLEYGMMLSQNKHIIPLQDKKYKLPFNIAPLDTIKYNEENFHIKVTEAVDNAIKRFSEREISGQIPQGPEIFTFYNLLGYKMSNTKIEFYELLYNYGVHLGFNLFDGKGNYKFIGSFDYEDPKKVILHTKLLIDNLVSSYESLISNIPKNVQENKFDYLIKKVSIDIIVPPFFEKREILNRAEKIINKKYKYTITVYYRKDINDKVEDAYKKIEDIEPIKLARKEKGK